MIEADSQELANNADLPPIWTDGTVPKAERVRRFLFDPHGKAAEDYRTASAKPSSPGGPIASCGPTAHRDTGPHQRPAQTGGSDL